MLIISVYNKLFFGIILNSNTANGYANTVAYAEKVNGVSNENEVQGVLDGFTFATCILNGDKEVVAQNGTFVLNTNDYIDVEVESAEPYTVHYVRLSSTDLSSVFIPGNFSGILGDRASQEDSPMVVVPYWCSVTLENGLELFVENKMMVPSYKLLFWFITLIFSVAVVFIPQIVLLIYVVAFAKSSRSIIQKLTIDPVTGGRSWNDFLELSDRELKKRTNAGRSYAIVDLYLMGYIGYCSCHCVSDGEKLIRNIHSALRNCLNKKEYCARYTKSNFAIFIECSSKEECETRLYAIIDILKQIKKRHRFVYHAGVYWIDGEQVRSKKKSERQAIDVESVYNHASAARASIDSADGSRVIFFDQNLLEDHKWHRMVEDGMEEALDNKEFKVYLQPKYSPSCSSMVGAEALVRWISPSTGFVAPNRFIPIFEKNGFITKLDDYMVASVAKLQSEWLSQRREVVPISVNISRAHFLQQDLAEHICHIVDEFNTPHNLIELELTESAFFDDKKQLLETVEKLKCYGFVISMDDFGVGYSSLNSLKDLPLDILKLDAEFFRGNDECHRGDIVVSEAIRLAKRLNMKTVAEGIEKKEQVEFLKLLGCDMIQGYFYAKPMPVDDFEKCM